MAFISKVERKAINMLLFFNDYVLEETHSFWELIICLSMKSMIRAFRILKQKETPIFFYLTKLQQKNRVTFSAD